MKPTGIFERVAFAEAKVARLEKLALRQADALAEQRDAIAILRADIKALQQVLPRIEWPEVEPVKLEPRIARMAEITAIVAAEHMLEPDALRGPDRHKAISDARQEAMLRMREAGHSYPKIGRFFHRDHTTVYHGCKAARVRRLEKGRK